MKELLFLGDSITDCDHSFDIEDLGDGYVRMIAKELEPHKVNVKNMGVDGFTVSALKRFWNLCCSKLKPDFITILIGINDVAVMKNTEKDIPASLRVFQSNYEALIEEIRDKTDCPILLMEPFIFPYPAEFRLWESEVRAMSRIIQDIAQKYELKFVPLWDRLLDAAEKKGVETITTDGVHLTSKGHRLIAEVWMEYNFIFYKHL